MKYLDLVELIKEKPAYTKAGVKIGDFRWFLMCLDE